MKLHQLGSFVKVDLPTGNRFLGRVKQIDISADEVNYHVIDPQNNIWRVNEHYVGEPIEQIMCERCGEIIEYKTYGHDLRRQRIHHLVANTPTYGSVHDGKKIDFHLCDHCLGELFEFLGGLR